MIKRLAMAGSAFALIALTCGQAGAQFKTSLNESQATVNEAARSQQRIDQLDDQTQTLLNDYRANLKQLEAARRYNESLTKQVAAQERQIVRIQQDIENVSGLQRAILPLMESMAAGFKQLVEADIPFDIAARTERADNRIANLDEPDSEISVAQKYRLLVEAYQIEMEFGRTIGTYEGTIIDNGEEITGEFLRIGRVSLMFKTSDDSILKIWNNSARAWENLDRSYLPDVKYGLRMAKEQTAPDLLPVPVPAPVAVQ
ncbi:MAG: DUF3450 domain-containing protein [Pseudomonadota bacterium]